MQGKIRYRLCHNYGGRLNMQGLAPVALECRQAGRKIYMSSGVMLRPDQWERGRVVNHENAEKLTVYLIRWRNGIEEIELDALLKGRQLTLFQLKTAVRTGLRASATVREFTESVISQSARKKTTKLSYRYLCNEVEKAYGRLTLDDITYDWIEKFRTRMRSHGLSENTIKGRLKALRCIVNEAIKRNLITEDPFRFVTIGNMTARVGYLEADEVRRLETVRLKGKEAVIRDLFLLGCYTGLRWGDLSTLEDAEIRDGLLRKTMRKTSHEVCIPIDTLFWGKAKEILDRYPNIRRLSHVCCSTTANRAIKEIAQRAGIRKNVYFHLARKTCSNLLNELGMPEQDITAVLGHTKGEVTRKHYLFNQAQHLRASAGDIFQNPSKTPKKKQRK